MSRSAQVLATQVLATPVLATVALVALLLVGPWVPVASAQSIQLAGDLYLGADFEGSRREARRVLTAETSSRDDVVGALRLLVALETILGQPERAAEAARLLVLIDASAEPAAGAPEEATAAVAAARQAPRPSVTLEVGTGVAIATAVDAPGNGVALWLECQDAAGTRSQAGPPAGPLRLPVDTAHDVRCRAQLRTLGGLALAETTDDFRPGHPDAARAGSGGDDTLWIALGITGGVLLVVTIIGVAVAASGPTEATFGAPVVIGW